MSGLEIFIFSFAIAFIVQSNRFQRGLTLLRARNNQISRIQRSRTRR
jgi:hypothetical protein